MIPPTEIYLYPRLARSPARSLMVQQAALDLTELRATAALVDTRAAPAATGGTPVPTTVLAKVQQGIRKIADEFGFPEPLTIARQQALDLACGSFLLQTMGIVPADAAEEGTWSFLSLVVLPEFGPWRFAARTEERLIGRPRNTLRRLWWRAWTLGPDLTWAPEGCTPLQEDEFVQLMERTTVSGNRRTAKAIQEALWRAEKDGIPLKRPDVVRELIPRVRAYRSHLCLDALTDEDLTELLDELVAKILQTDEPLEPFLTPDVHTLQPADDAAEGRDVLDNAYPGEEGAPAGLGTRVWRYLAMGNR